MPSNAQRGAAWKARTRRYWERLGYIVADMEIVRYVWTPNGRWPQKRDQWGCDLLAAHPKHGYVWVQVKGFSVKRPSLAPARRKFAEYPLLPYTRRVIVLWKLGAREPEVIEVA